MITFTCELKDKNYSFKTTSVMKLMRFIWVGDVNNQFIITIENDKDSNFIKEFKVPDHLKTFADKVEEAPDKVVIEWQMHSNDAMNDDNIRDMFEIEVNMLITYIVETCIFAHNHSIIDQLNSGKVHFELEQDIQFDWNFEIINMCKNDDGEDYEERLYSATVPMFVNLNWFITITIFRYITGRPMVIASPDCINMVTKQTPLLGSEY